jgi:ABC-2 type transport system permease protein
MYFKYVRLNLLASLQYRASLVMTLIGHIFNVSFTLLGIWMLFERFGSLKGWTFGEVALCYACVLTAYSVTEIIARGFDLCPEMVKDGSFDRIMLRPRSTVLQMLGSYFDVVKIGRIAVGIVVYSIALPQVGIDWTIGKAVTLALMNFSGIVVFMGIYILSATVSFWTVEGLEFLNILLYGGQQMTSYPLTIYPKPLIFICSYIIPFGCFNYLPLLYLTGRSANPVYALTPLLCLPFFAVSLLVWRCGVKHYLSTGN